MPPLGHGVPTVRHVIEFDAAEGQRFARDVVAAMGGSAADARCVAELLVRAEVGGHASHGLRRLPQYARGWRNGTIVPSARPEIVRDDGSTLILDGRRALGRWCVRRRPTSRQTTRSPTVSRQSLCATPDTRAASPTTRIAPARRVRRCWRSRTTPARIRPLRRPAAWRGACRRIRWPQACPARSRRTSSIDLATSVAAQGKVRVLQDAGRPVPEAWVRDGLLQPLGGAKGFALALLVEALAGVVSGAGAVGPDPGPDDQGVFLLAFDLARFGDPAELAGRVDAMLAHVLTAPVQDGAEPLRAPGSALPPLPLDPEARFALAPRSWSG